VEDEEERADKKEERRKKAAGGKAGGGAQGRETKTKSTANKKRPSKGQQREMVFSLMYPIYLGEKERIFNFFMFFIFFWRARVCRPLLRLCRPFMFFEGCLDSNPECCCSKLARYRLSHPSLCWQPIFF
jgi:hypothetical protein